ncbi:MAG: 16S rRNA (guanine(527)-N(7))-methyltransferase RsmG [Pseudomonadota bacterium]
MRESAPGLFLGYAVSMLIPNDKQLLQRLLDGAASLQVALTQQQAVDLIALVRLLERWRRAYNLTAISEPMQMVEKHLLDSLSLAPYVTSGPVLDVGTGAGFPGLPLALLRPELSFTLLDAHAKKLRFVTQAAATMRLDNLRTAHSRVEDYQPDAGYSIITTRAFASLQQMTQWCEHLLAPAGKLLAMKGHVSDDELGAVPASWHATVEPVVVPFINGARHIVTLTPA